MNFAVLWEQKKDKLKKLLDPKENDEVTYFNIQKLMNKHFISKKSLNENN